MMHKPIEHRDQLADRVAALERTMRRLERANASNEQALADSRAEAILTLFSLLLRMLHSGPFDLHVYRGQVTDVAEFFAEAAGAHGAGNDAADLCRLLLASIDPKEPRIRPQLRLVSSRDDAADPASQPQSISE
jgi:hypothetical protein